MTSHIRETKEKLVIDNQRLKNPFAFVQQLIDKKS